MATETTKTDDRCDRWHELAVYRLAGDKYVVHAAYRTGRKPREIDVHFAITAASARDLARELVHWAETHDMDTYVTGFPAGVQFEAKRARVMQSLRTRMRDGVSRLLGKVPGAEESLQ